jgi:hypothetical protein
LFEFINTKKTSAKYYNLIFALRRLLFILLSIYYNISGAVIVICMSANLLYGIYAIRTMAFENKYSNYQDIFNELMVAFSTFWMVLYTEVV